MESAIIEYLRTPPDCTTGVKLTSDTGVTIPSQSSVAKALQEFDYAGNMKPSPCRPFIGVNSVGEAKGSSAANVAGELCEFPSRMAHMDFNQLSPSSAT